MADKIKVPFDLKQNFHPEFDGYEPGEWTQGPFPLPTPPSRRRVPVLLLPISSPCLPAPGEEVKQADVVLLGYPVPFSLSPQVRRKNLEVYEAVTSPQGPAMTWVSGVVPTAAPALPPGLSSLPMP